jgi:hypothetical protein
MSSSILPERRRLSFETMDSIMPDVDGLIDGHITVGCWTLGAICDHLARTINLSMDSSPADAPATREQDIYRRRFFRASAFPEGQKPPLAIQEPPLDADLSTAVESLRNAVARLKTHVKPFAAHPILGPLTRDEWLQFHARHAAHHLSFAVPV